MPTYHITVTVTWVQSVNAGSEESAREMAQNTFKDEFNFTPKDCEIISIEEQEAD